MATIKSVMLSKEIYIVTDNATLSRGVSIILVTPIGSLLKLHDWGG